MAAGRSSSLIVTGTSCSSCWRGDGGGTKARNKNPSTDMMLLSGLRRPLGRVGRDRIRDEKEPVPGLGPPRLAPPVPRAGLVSLSTRRIKQCSTDEGTPALQRSGN